jgi:hypothetical protein
VTPRDVVPRRGPAAERGSITVELAMALPFVVALLGAALFALSAVGAQIRLQHTVATAARAQGRGDAPAAAAVLAEEAPNASVSFETRDDVVCLTCRRVLLGGAIAVPVTATSCAATSGR